MGNGIKKAKATSMNCTRFQLPHYKLLFCIILSVLLSNEVASCFSTTPANGSNWKATDEVLPSDYYRQVYNSGGQKQPIPWDVGGPQPCVKNEARTGIFAKKSILDCGCGLGENAQFLAGNVGRAQSVTGFDISPAAIQIASENIHDSSSQANVSFRVASCTELSESFSSQEKFDIAVDSACLHCLSDQDAMVYANSLKDLVRERLFVGCFSTANGSDGWTNPRRISREDLTRYFGSDWDILRIEDVWWARPSARGSNQGGFCHGLWMEAVKKNV